MVLHHCFETEIGMIAVDVEEGAVVGVEISARSARGSDLLAPKPDWSAKRSDPLALLAEKQIREYLAGERQVFDLPLNPAGTDFQKKVWQALLEIPYGKTETYGGIAARIGNPKAARAVGMANNRNQIAIIIPCHRVIGADGSLVGYAGGLDIKKSLLQKEGVLHRNTDQ